MSNWIQITVEDLYAYLVAAQVEALRKRALAKNQEDPVEVVIRNVSENIRAQIASNKKNALSQTAYALPQELKNEACILILEVAQTRIPGLKLTADQVRLANEARVQLQKVVSGAFIITQPNDRLTDNKRLVEVVDARPRIVRGTSMRGF